MEEWLQDAAGPVSNQASWSKQVWTDLLIRSPRPCLPYGASTAEQNGIWKLPHRECTRYQHSAGRRINGPPW